MIAPVSQWGTTWWVMSHSYSHYTVNTAASCQEAEKRAWASSWIMKLHNSRISPLIVSMATHFNLNNHHIVEETSTKSNRFTLQSSFGSLKCFNDSNKTFVLLGGGGVMWLGGSCSPQKASCSTGSFLFFSPLFVDIKNCSWWSPQIESPDKHAETWNL